MSLLLLPSSASLALIGSTAPLPSSTTVPLLSLCSPAPAPFTRPPLVSVVSGDGAGLGEGRAGAAAEAGLPRLSRLPRLLGVGVARPGLRGVVESWEAADRVDCWE